jgi:hypothetical protein
MLVPINLIQSENDLGLSLDRRCSFIFSTL